MKAHPEVDQDGYCKSVLKGKIERGLHLEVIFYSKVGGDHNKLRAEFLVTLLDAAKRLDLKLVPGQLHTNYPEFFQGQDGSPAQQAKHAPQSPRQDPAQLQYWKDQDSLLSGSDMANEFHAMELEAKGLLEETAQVSLEDLMPSRPNLRARAGYAHDDGKD
mmetsp:Transcript_33647/g.52348  ORF Transcript_33647/g.52348 Transcript_33647/m.52348 type:complete len:161 (-) Transcript_33647:147-629(-)